MNKKPTIEDIFAASKRIRPYANRTPILTSNALNGMFGRELYFKCENFQKVGAFKFRGACNAVLSLSNRAAEKGVATHSSGNHAQAVALAARIRGIDAYIVMPDNAPAVKKAAVAGYGAKITFCQSSLEARESTLEKIVQQNGAAIVHPYNNERVIAGQGTAAIELLEEVDNLDLIIVPVGGGGLLSGTALAVSNLSPKTNVIGAEPKEADDAFRSLKAGRIIPSRNPNTIADGLLTSLGDITFAIIQKHVNDIITVSEAAIITAMRMVWERMKIIIEPSSAVPVAALMENPQKIEGRRIGIIITGGNVDLGKLPW